MAEICYPHTVAYVAPEKSTEAVELVEMLTEHGATSTMSDTYTVEAIWQHLSRRTLRHNMLYVFGQFIWSKDLPILSLMGREYLPKKPHCTFL